MPSPSSRSRRTLAAILAAAMAAGVGAGPATAKEFLVATLDAPIAMDSPPGAVLLVGITVMAPDGDGGALVPVVGSPVYLTLTGRYGATTRAAAEGTRTDGYYLFHIEVPAGGPRGLEVGIHGSSQDGPLDLPMMLTAVPFTFGPIREGTAQLAAPVAPAASMPAVPAAPSPPAPVAGAPTVEAAPGEGGATWAPVAVLVALRVALLVAVAVVLGRGVGARSRGGAATSRH